MDKESFLGKMVINMKEIGLKIKDLVKAYLKQKLEKYMKGNGLMIKEMAMVLKFMKMVINIKGVGSITLNKDKENLILLMETNILDILCTINLMVKEI